MHRRSGHGPGGISIIIRGRGPKLKINYRTTKHIRRFATALLEDDIKPSAICIVARTATPLKPLAKVLQSKQIANYTISRGSTDHCRIPDVWMANRHSVMGLKFRIAFLRDIRDRQMSFRRPAESTDGPVEKPLKDLNERALLHVAAIRAVNGLYETWAAHPSEYFNQLNGTQERLYMRSEPLSVWLLDSLGQ